MENNEAFNAIKNHTLFSVLKGAELETITANAKEISLGRKSRIDSGAGLWSILSGKATAYTPDSEASNPLNYFSSGDVSICSLFDMRKSYNGYHRNRYPLCLYTTEGWDKRNMQQSACLSLIKTLTGRSILSRKNRFASLGQVKQVIISFRVRKMKREKRFQ